MSSPAPSTAVTHHHSYAVTISTSLENIRAAQRLRYQVFGTGREVRLQTPLPGHDVDEFDELADHLIVTETGTREVAGTYRLMPPGRSERLYADGQFNLSSLVDIRPQLLEVGPSCIHPAHRTGALIDLMWSALARHVLQSGHRYLAGCAAVPLDDGGWRAASAWLLGTAKHAAPPALRVHPHRPWQPTGPLKESPPSYADLPPLLLGYLRLGAWICGAPAVDPKFGVANFYVLLPVERISDRYQRYYLGKFR